MPWATSHHSQFIIHTEQQNMWQKDIIKEWCFGGAFELDHQCSPLKDYWPQADVHASSSCSWRTNNPTQPEQPRWPQPKPQPKQQRLKEQDKPFKIFLDTKTTNLNLAFDLDKYGHSLITFLYYTSCFCKLVIYKITWLAFTYIFFSYTE